MGDIIEFSIGCRRCKHLVQIGKNTYTCDAVDADGQSVYPIVDGLHTEDWDVCDGEYYERSITTRKSRRSS